MTMNLPSSSDTGLSELKRMIAGTIAAFSDRKLRWKAMKAIQWRMRGPNGEFVGLRNIRCSFVPENEAMIFDGRDNEDMKVQTYEAALGKLTVEIIPQITRG